MAGTFFLISNGRKLVVESGCVCELNPVKAGMVRYAWAYPWSRVHAHLSGEDNFGFVETDKLLVSVGDWKNY